MSFDMNTVRIAMAFITIALLLAVALYKWLEYRIANLALVAYFIEQFPDKGTFRAWYEWEIKRTIRKLLHRPPPDSIPHRARNYRTAPVKEPPAATLDTQRLKTILTVNNLLIYHLRIIVADASDETGEEKRQRSIQFLHRHFGLSPQNASESEGLKNAADTETQAGRSAGKL